MRFSSIMKFLILDLVLSNVFWEFSLRARFCCSGAGARSTDTRTIILGASAANRMQIPL